MKDTKLLMSLGGVLLLQACASQGPAQPADRDIFLFGSYPVFVQQQICTTTRTGTLTADQQRIALAVSDQRYGCYANRRRSRTNPRGIYLAPYGSVTASALVIAADFKVAANLAAMREAQRSRAQLDAAVMGTGLGGGIGLRTGGMLR